MEKLKLLIADSDIHFGELVRQFLKNHPDIEVCACEHHGADALHSIKTLHPDAVLFDLALPGLDGINLLRSVSLLKNPPAMICCTRFYSEVAMEAMRSFGADYLMYKPVELQSLRPVILSCTELHRRMRASSHRTEAGIENAALDSARIRNYIVSLGVPSKLIGCSYLAEAVRLARMDMSLTRNLSKGLYLEISRSMDTTPARIERCIRNAVSIAYQSGGMEGRMISCPSNKEFINYVLRTIDL